MEHFDRLGAEIERAWQARDRDEERFADVAAQTLAKSEAFDLDALVDNLLDPVRPSTRQLAALGAFGQPGITVFYGRGFVIDVYFWTDAISAIHNHPFCGAFKVLRGLSAHAVYSWEEREALGPRLRLGEARLEDLALLEPGHVERFSLREHPLLHALVHIAVPTVSMVVRTVRTVGYLHYFPPSVAISADEPDDTIVRQLALLDHLRRVRDPRHGERLVAFLRNADLETSFRALWQSFPRTSDEERGRLVGIVRERHGARADALAPAVARVLRVQDVDAVRARLTADDDRLIATALMLSDRREHALALLARRHAEPIARLHRFVDEAGLFAEDEEAMALIAHRLIEGDDLERVERALVEAYGEAAVSEQIEAVRRYATRSMFAPLGVTA